MLLCYVTDHVPGEGRGAHWSEYSRKAPGTPSVKVSVLVSTWCGFGLFQREVSFSGKAPEGAKTEAYQGTPHN